MPTETIAEKLVKLNQIKADLKTKIEAKGVTVGTADFEDYPSLVEDIPSGGGTLITKSITANGTYDAQDDNADGYSEVTVNVSPTLFRGLVDKTISGKITAEDLNGITEIGTNVFYGCDRITSIEIPSSVASIGASAFRYAQGLQRIIILAVEPPILANVNAVQYTNDCPIYVLYSIIDTFKSATNWSSIATRIFPLVAVVADLTNIDTTEYTKACVIGADNSYKEYTYDGSQWNEVT